MLAVLEMEILDHNHEFENVLQKMVLSSQLVQARVRQAVILITKHVTQSPHHAPSGLNGDSGPDALPRVALDNDNGHAAANIKATAKVTQLRLKTGK